MNQNSVFCIAFSHLQADQMVQRLKGAAFSTQDISVIAAVGPLVAELGDLARSFISLGVPWPKARSYEGRIKEGRILVAVQTGRDEDAALAKEIFSKAGGSDICTTHEISEQYNPVSKLQLVSRSTASLSYA